MSSSTQPRRRLSVMAVSALFAAALTACGGGGGGDDPAGVNPPAPAPAPAPGPAPAPAPGTTEVRGLTQQAEPNGSYIINAAQAGNVVVTLPQAPTAGSTVRVSGQSDNSWSLALNPGQYVDTTGLTGNTAPGAVFNPLAPVERWWSAGMSDNGNVIAAVSNLFVGQGTGTLYVSSDGGATFTTPIAAGRNWLASEVSGDGTTIVATTTKVTGSMPTISISSDSGATWRSADIGVSLLDVHVSTNGQFIAAVDSNFGAGGNIYVSTNGGQTFTATSAPVANWQGISGSADGTRLVAISFDDGVYVSTNSGTTWTRAPGIGVTDWYRVDASADGQRIIVGSATNGGIQVSTDGGATWTGRLAGLAINQVSMSADGQTVLLAVPGNELHLSTDGGATFVPVGGTSAWRAAAVSADGNRMVAGSNAAGSALQLSGGNRTGVGIGGISGGGQGEMIELEYTGNGRFTVRNHTGTFVVN